MGDPEIRSCTLILHPGSADINLLTAQSPPPVLGLHLQDGKNMS